MLLRAYMKRTIIECVRSAGTILLKRFCHKENFRRKENQSSIVSSADIAAEKHIVACIKTRFPQHNIIAEESGHIGKSSKYTWVVDPLDGTSNFVAGLPWFGVQVVLLRETSPVMAAIYLPVEDALYFSERDHGVYRNGKRVKATPEIRLSNILLAFGLDADASRRNMQRNARLFTRLSCSVRNVRATNSVVDFCYLLDGRIGGIVNMHTKIWDILPLSLMLPEAGGHLTDLKGCEITFELGQKDYGHNYEVLGTSNTLYPKLLKLLIRH